MKVLEVFIEGNTVSISNLVDLRELSRGQRDRLFLTMQTWGLVGEQLEGEVTYANSDTGSGVPERNEDSSDDARGDEY